MVTQTIKIKNAEYSPLIDFNIDCGGI